LPPRKKERKNRDFCLKPGKDSSRLSETKAKEGHGIYAVLGGKGKETKEALLSGQRRRYFYPEISLFKSMKRRRKLELNARSGKKASFAEKRRKDFQAPLFFHKRKKEKKGWSG